MGKLQAFTYSKRTKTNKNEIVNLECDLAKKKKKTDNFSSNIIS